MAKFQVNGQIKDFSKMANGHGKKVAKIAIGEWPDQTQLRTDPGPISKNGHLL